jgi:hypothetical protein
MRDQKVHFNYLTLTSRQSAVNASNALSGRLGLEYRLRGPIVFHAKTDNA